MNCSPPGFSVHGILQAGILEWVAISSSRDLPDPGIEPLALMSSALAGGFFMTSAAWEALPAPTSAAEISCFPASLLLRACNRPTLWGEIFYFIASKALLLELFVSLSCVYCNPNKCSPPGSSKICIKTGLPPSGGRRWPAVRARSPSTGGPMRTSLGISVIHTHLN